MKRAIAKQFKLALPLATKQEYAFLHEISSLMDKRINTPEKPLLLDDLRKSLANANYYRANPQR